MSKKKWIKPGPMTGYPPGLLQDDDPMLSKWFASRLDARRIVRSVCEEIRNENERRNGRFRRGLPAMRSV